MSEGPQREWRFYLADMIGFAEKVVIYTHEFYAAHSPRFGRSSRRLALAQMGAQAAGAALGLRPCVCTRYYGGYASRIDVGSPEIGNEP